MLERQLTTRERESSRARERRGLFVKKETKQEKKQMRGERERSNESLRHSKERERKRRGGGSREAAIETSSS